MDFHFLVMEKSWKINVEKEGHPAGTTTQAAVAATTTAGTMVCSVQRTYFRFTQVSVHIYQNATPKLNKVHFKQLLTLLARILADKLLWIFC